MNYEELRKKIRNLIYVEWDPIGVAGIDGAEDEYRQRQNRRRPSSSSRVP